MKLGIAVFENNSSSHFDGHISQDAIVIVAILVESYRDIKETFRGSSMCILFPIMQAVLRVPRYY